VRHPLLLVLALAAIAVPQAARAQSGWLARLEAGTLGPDDPFSVTLSFGAGAGITRGSNAWLFRVLRQSRDRNSGADVGHGRTFLLANWERSFRAAGPQGRQAFIRVGGGWLLRSPFKSTWAVDLAAGLKYRLVPRLFIVGVATDLLAMLPNETFTYCVPGAMICGPAKISSELQSNLGLLISLEWRL
jgi:opacity protein-like surface antigen